MYGPELSSTHCCVCDCEIWLRSDRIRALRESHDSFYCPNGHKQHFTGKSPSEIEKEQLRKRLEEAETSARLANQRAARVEREAKLNANKCTACGRRFETADGLKQHVRRVHKRPLALPAQAGPSN